MAEAPPHCPLLEPFDGEEEALRPRGDEHGQVGDPRNLDRKLQCRTRYLRSPFERRLHELRVDRIGRLRKVHSGDVFDTVGMCAGIVGLDPDHQIGRALYTLSGDGTIYAACSTTNSIGVREFVKVMKAPWSNASASTYVPDVLEFFHHSSFVAGAEVRCAGELGIAREGYVHTISNYSGHYKPRREHLLHFVDRLASAGVPLGGAVIELVGADGGVRFFPAEPWLASGGGEADELPIALTRSNLMGAFSHFSD
jgi:hypothetical protein